ncbi:MAG: uroporphyrinogen decarboxylase family protein [bacterium]
MTGREIVKRSLSFSNPERVPMSLPKPYPNDFIHAGIGPHPKDRTRGWERVGDRWEMIDEWGNTWARLEGFSKGEVVKGVIEDSWDLLDSYEFPALDLPERYEGARRLFGEDGEHFRLGGLPGFPFNIARYMRRMEIFLMDVLLEKERTKQLLDAIAGLLERCIARFAEAGADGVMFPEDWGTQDRLLVSPKTWRELFKPGFARLCKAAHDRGLTVWMHSCGHIYEIIGDLIEVGIDVLQFDQPALHGIENLSRDFGGRVNFWCPVDIQRVLPTRDAKLIEEEAKRMIEKLGCFGGGFIAGYYGSNEALGLEPEWQDIACRAFVKYGTRQEIAMR